MTRTGQLVLALPLDLSALEKLIQDAVSNRKIKDRGSWVDEAKFLRSMIEDVKVGAIYETTTVNQFPGFKLLKSLTTSSGIGGYYPECCLEIVSEL